MPLKAKINVSQMEEAENAGAIGIRQHNLSQAYSIPRAVKEENSSLQVGVNYRLLP